jgi:putative tryptophan/tyrosine transport system substrate-binding protein
MNIEPVNRRSFITLLGGAAASWPLAARAQQPAMPVIGFLTSTPPQLFANMIDAFRQGLAELGYAEGRNVTFEYRTAGAEYERFQSMAAELVRRPVSVIFATGGTAAVLAAKKVTATIPILFYVGGDPVAQGLVASVPRPGGNATGMHWLGGALGAKRLELLRELVPTTTLVGMLVKPDNPESEFEIRDVQRGADSLGLKLQVFNAAHDPDFDSAFAALIEQRADALLVGSDPYFSSRRGRIIALAGRHGVPAIYERREFPEAGGLISYGGLRADAYRQLGIYAGRILMGAKPADLPVLQPTKFEIVINLNAAKALGLDIPATVLARADEVIE